MFTCTENAIAKIKNVLAQEADAKGIRIVIGGGGCCGPTVHLCLETEEPSDVDKTYEFNGIKIFVDPVADKHLEGAKIDFIETAERESFTFVLPNLPGGGCGSGCDSGGCGCE